MQQIERLKMIDELLNKIPSKLTEMSDPSTKATLPRVEDIRPGLIPHTFQSPPQNTGDTPKPMLEKTPRVRRNKSKTTVSDKDKTKAINREQIKQIFETQQYKGPESHNVTKCNCDKNKENKHS